MHFSCGLEAGGIQFRPARFEADFGPLEETQLQLGQIAAVAFAQECGEGRRVGVTLHAQAHVAGLLHQITANLAAAEADGRIADV